MTNEIEFVRLSKKERQTWTELLISSPYGSHRQSFELQEYQQKLGWKSEGYLFKQRGKSVGGAFYSRKDAPLGLAGLGEVSGGFSYFDKITPELVSCFLDHFLGWAKDNRIAIVRLPMWLPASISGNETDLFSDLRGVIEDAGFSETEHRDATYWIGLDQDEDKIMAKFTKQTRYDIRRAEKEGVEVEVTEDVQILETFFDLYDSRGKQKALNYLTREQFITMSAPLVNAGLAKIFVAWHAGKIRNMTLASCLGQGRSIFSALAPATMEDKSCPSTGQKLQWEVIRTLKQLGLRYHDMGGVVGPKVEKGAPTYGIWRFKHSFGGDYVEFFPVYRKILRPLLGRGIRLIGQMKKRNV